MHTIIAQETAANPTLRRFTASLAAWLFLAAALTSAAFLLDDAVIAWVNAHQFKGLKNAAGAISRAGDWPPIFALGTLLLGLAGLKRNERWKRIAAMMILSALAAGLIANSLREVCGRTRPNAKVPPGWYGLAHDGNWFSHTNQFHSFPSGHSAVIMAFCLPLLVFAPKIGRPTMLAVVLVAGSRIYLAVHHLSDVTASLFIGAACFTAVRAVLERRWGGGLPPRATRQAER